MKLSQLLRLPATWFSVKKGVGPFDYAVSGILLTALKYGFESVVLYQFVGIQLTPAQFINPFLQAREAALNSGPQWLPPLFYLWTLPFLWIAVSMSVRRAADAGHSPWLGFLVLMPLINLAVMLVFCVLPSSRNLHWSERFPQASGWRSPREAALAVGISVILGGMMVVASIYVLKSYGSSLFLGTPMMMGATASYFYNRWGPGSFGISAVLGMIAVLAGCLAMLLFALEGILCLAMAVPIAVPVAAFGGLLGKAIADASHRRPHEIAAALIMLPVWATGESYFAAAPERVVLTSVEVDAPPSSVWSHVIEFPDLPEARAWYFRLGIACPERATIIGKGVGAVRRCQFSTGDFVEPITAWEVDRRLAFDVTEQPPPMLELSPYPGVHPPHLEGVLTCTRGEFCLVALANGKTRLEGRTWYASRMNPQWYFTLWTDLFIHRIHERVLVHIRLLAEAEDKRTHFTAQALSPDRPRRAAP